MPRHTLATTALLITISSLSAGVASADRAVEAPAAGATRAPMPSMRRAPSVPVVPADVPVPGRHFAQPPGERPHAYREPVLDRATIRARLIENRRANLERFRAYQRSRVFPSNVYQQGLLNVWRDQDGHLCAAATIIDASGASELVRRVADQNNFIRLADVRQGPLMDWILTSGFTQDEIAAIQAPYMPVTKRPAPAPVDPVVVDATLRRAETARLAKRYREVDAQLVRDAARSLELAVDRLMKRHDLAWQLVGAA